MNTGARPKWATTAVVIYAGLGSAISIGLASVFGILATADYLKGDTQAGFFGVWTSFAFTVIAIAGLPAIVLGIQILWLKRADPARTPSRAWMAAFILYPLGLALGYAIFERHGIPPLFGTFAQLLALGGPILTMAVLIQLSGQTISALRAWGHFLLGLWLIPTLAFILELVLLIAGIFIVVAGLLLSPAGQQLLSQLQAPPGQLFSQPPPELVTQAVSQPWVIALAVLFISVLIPIVEEGLKSIAIWPILRRSPGPSQAFIGGALGGLGFALVEGMFLTQPDMTWLLTALIRAGASMMHAMAAGITAWGLAEAVVRRRFWRLPLAYVVAIGLHGLWNLSAVSLGVAQLGHDVGLSSITPPLENLLTVTGAVMLGLLSLLAAGSLPIIARRLAAQSTQGEHAGDILIEPRN
jgi:hypothetical protein